MLVAFAAAAPAKAGIAVTGKVMQRGMFSPPKCSGAQDCLCESDIRYPIISGMRDTGKQNALNTAIEQSAAQLKCQGTPVNAKSTGDNFSVSHNYEITFSSPDILGLKFTDWAYEGGAHGNGTIEGMIIDLASGRTLLVDDVFGTANTAAVNKVIYDTLAPKAEGVFRDAVEERRNSFIKDNACQGCTLAMTRNGVQVIFQAYEVAPFADGNPAITIPRKYISNPVVLRMLAAPESANSP